MRIARSARAPPLFRSVVNASCPGVSMKKSPGRDSLISNFFKKSPQIFSITSIGI